MTTTLAQARPATAVRPFRSGRPLRHLAFVATPLVWAGVALVHPLGEDDAVYEGLRDKVALWIGIHVAQLALALGVGAALWAILKDVGGSSARLARLAVPVYLVFFAAFDSVTGLASGLAVHHANSVTGPARAGAASTAEYLVMNPIAGNVSGAMALGTIALIVAFVGAALSLRKAGASRVAWLSVLAGVLLASHAGPPAAAGLAVLALGFHLAHRDGFMS